MNSNIERYSFLLILCFAVEVVSSFFARDVISGILGLQEYMSFNTKTGLITVSYNLLRIATHIFFAIWLYRCSKMENRKPFTWALFGLCFGISAFALYLLLEIKTRQDLKDKRLTRTGIEAADNESNS